MTGIRKKLAINDLTAIDFYDDAGKWVACIWETPPNNWSVRLHRVELLSCYRTEGEAFCALDFWVDFQLTHIPD